MEYALSNDSISIKVSTAGGSFTSIEAGGREYLWQGDPAVWSGQAPICFPICGGLRDNNAMTFAGHHVKLARHGFARKQEWKLLSQSENELAMCLASEDNAALLSDYPYPFKLVARYTLEDAAVRVSYEVTNEGTEDSRVKINASVSEDVFAGLHTGDSAGVQISVLSDEVKSAKIVSLPAAANQQTNLYDVSVSVPSGTEPAIGAFATVIFYTDRRENTLSVPTDCVLTGNDNERYLFTVDESGTTAARVTVETGLVGKTNTEITSGLNEGDRVVVKGQSYLSDGSAVRVVTSDGGEG